MTKAAVAAALGPALSEKLRAHRDGTFTIKRSYFYRVQAMGRGGSPEKLAEMVKKQIPNAEIIYAVDKFLPWPKDSRFEVKFRVKT